jgi:diphosphomevalonate decarboxylase
MKSIRILARAPSNIAIVKYMGKRDPGKNIPANPSLSMTLSALCTYVEIRSAISGGVRLVAEKPKDSKGEAPNLSSGGREKFLLHFARVMERGPSLLSEFSISSRNPPEHVEIRSSNTFPASAGIASSASSFAALTLATAAYLAKDQEIFRERYSNEPSFRRALAALSREGSGSSCRSFEGPFVSWDEECTERVPSALRPLSDLVVVVSAGEKFAISGYRHGWFPPIR